MPAHKKQGTNSSATGPGSLLLPYGNVPWHFKQGEYNNDVHGTGFNGAIKHSWKPDIPILMPGKGYVTRYDG